MGLQRDDDLRHRRPLARQHGEPRGKRAADHRRQCLRRRQPRRRRIGGRSSVSSARTSAGTAFIACTWSSAFIGSERRLLHTERMHRTALGHQIEHVDVPAARLGEKIRQIGAGQLAVANERRNLGGHTHCRRRERSLRGGDRVGETHGQLAGPRIGRRTDRAIDQREMGGASGSVAVGGPGSCSVEHRRRR